MKRYQRIVVKPVQVDYFNQLDSRHYTITVLQECYSSPWRVDCQHWIERQKAKGDNTFYSIYVEDLPKA